MPTYTYRREDGTTFDIKQKFLDDPLETCPSTGQAVVRVIQPAGIIFKGSGFYVNDNSKATNPANPANKHAENNGSSDSSNAKSETKSETRSETKSEAKVSTAAAD